MQNKWTQRLTLALAATALFAVAGGPSYAASKINGNTIKTKSISGSKLKANTLTGTQINESALGTVPKATTADSAGTATTAATANAVADNAITSSKVADNSLTGADVSLKSGTLSTYDAPNVGAQVCVQDVVSVSAGVDLRDAVVAVTMESNWPSGLAVTVENSTAVGAIRLNLCNNSAAAIDAPVVPFHWIAFAP